MRKAFLAIPKELEEAALMEGCSWWQVLFRVLLPMSWPSVLAFATVSITYHWNEYLWPLMMLNDPDKQVLTVGLVFRHGRRIRWPVGHHRRRDADGLPAADAGVYPFSETVPAELRLLRDQIRSDSCC